MPKKKGRPHMAEWPCFSAAKSGLPNLNNSQKLVSFTFFILVPKAGILFHVLIYCIPVFKIRIRFALYLNKNSLVSYQRNTSGHIACTVK